VQTIESFGCDIQRSDKPERELSTSEIVIDRLRHTTHRNAALVKLVRERECAFTTKDHECVDTNDLHVGDRFLVNAFNVSITAFARAFDKLSAIPSPENRATTRQQAAYIARRQQARASGIE